MGQVCYVRLDANAAVSIPFESTKTGANGRIFVCANQGILIMVLPSKQADGNAPTGFCSGSVS